MGQRIADLPEDIKKLVIQRWDEYKASHDGNEYTSDTAIRQCVSNVFHWEGTPEGHEFWSRVNDGKYDTFYKRYPKHVEPVINDQYSII